MHRIRLLAVLVFAALLLAVPARPASLSAVVVSQVYAGGGNSGASFDHDFVELFNPGAGPADVNGWIIQYASAGSGTWQTTILAGQIAGRPLLPRPAGLRRVDRRRAAGRRRHRHHQHGRLRRQGRPRHRWRLRSRAARPRAAARPPRPSRTSSATARRATTRARRRSVRSRARPAAVRADGGCTDTDSNHDDFSVAAPTPRNSSARRVDLLGGPAASADGHVAGRRRRRRRPAGAVALARAADDQLRVGVLRRHPDADLRAGHGRQQQRGRLRAGGAPHRVHAGRSAARPREHRSRRRNARRLARRRRPGRDPDRARSRPGDRHDVGAQRPPAATPGRRRSASRARCPPSLRATTPRPSPTR